VFRDDIKDAFGLTEHTEDVDLKEPEGEGDEEGDEGSDNDDDEGSEELDSMDGEDKDLHVPDNLDEEEMEGLVGALGYDTL
jgi:hypothetical protein